MKQKIGAGNESRTRDLNLGKVALYQLSYSRFVFAKSKEAAIIATSVFVSSRFVKLFEFVPCHFQVVTHGPNGEHGGNQHQGVTDE